MLKNTNSCTDAAPSNSHKGGESKAVVNEE